MLASDAQDLTLRLQETMRHILQNYANPPVENTLLAATHYALAHSGKMLRGHLLLGGCRALAGDMDKALFAAVAVEYLHLGTLIHDDIIDQDELRRGRPSVWKQYSPDMALLSGDLLYFAAYQFLARSFVGGDSRLAARVLNIFATACMDLCLGQALEEKLVENCSASYEDYLEVARLKTASLIRSSVQMGTLLGGGSEQQVEIMGQGAEQLGVAFQIIDDLLPFTSSSEVIGKPITSDIKNHRLTAPIIYALAVASESDKQVLRAIFEHKAFDHRLDDAYTSIREILTRTDALRKAKQDVKQRYQHTVDAFHVLPPNDGRDYLMLMANQLVQRNK